MTPEQRLATDVLPWMERLGALLPDPPRISTHEGYAGNGILGARAGPVIEFESVVHELAHGFEMVASRRFHAFGERAWGMKIATQVMIAGQSYDHPVSHQATSRETRASAIQLRLLQAVDHPSARGFIRRQAEVLCRWMPDWHMGGQDEKERLQHRARLIRQAYRRWPLERIQSAWPQVKSLLDDAYQASLIAPEPRVRRVSRST